MENIYWTTITGKKILVDNMSDNHLRNTLKMVNKNDNKNYWYVLTSNRNLRLQIDIRACESDSLKSLLKDHIQGKGESPCNINNRFVEEELLQAYYDSNTDMF